jgi:hypothetical protein
MKNYQLKSQAFIDPRWMRLVGQDGAGVVDETGRAVTIHGESLDLEEPLRPGIQVKVWLGRFFYCNTVKDLEEQEVLLEKQREFKAQKRKEAENKHRAEAEEFNSEINVPVEWTTGQKDVLSGLSENSWGDGRRSNTVNHIFLKEDLVDGRLKRSAGDFLCTSSGGSNGKNWAGDPEIYLIDGDGNQYLPKVTCKACLKIAKRWNQGN